MADSSPPNVPLIVETLNNNKVEYLLVGGLAATLHGAKRPTFDFDCLARQTPENFERLATALKQLNARLRVGGLSDEEAALLPVQLDGIALARMGISTWRTDAGDIDVMIDMPDRSGTRHRFEHFEPRSARQELAGIIVSVAALPDVIASKEHANRPKDLDALPELRAIAEQTPAVPPHRRTPPPTPGLSR
jgi:hypothetical protein